MLARIFLFITVVSFVELALLLWIGALIGTVGTLIMVLATAFVGAILIRREGLKTLTSVVGALATGQAPATALAEGLCLILAGALLITPGILTDLAGLALLWQPTRKRIAPILGRSLAAKLGSTFARASSGQGGVRFWSFTAGGAPPSAAGPGFSGARRPTPSSPSRLYREGDVIDLTNQDDTTP
jgi:UPF0716 protein FxsA